MPRKKSAAGGQAGDVLSTKEAANICKVALSTIVYWFDKGLIRGYRTPGGHRRIFRVDLEKFMKDHAIPLGDRLDDRLRVLVVGSDEPLMELLGDTLKSMNGRLDWAAAAGSFQAGRLVATFKPNLILVDDHELEASAESLCRQVKEDPDTRDIDMVLLSANGSSPGDLRDAGASEVLNKPVTRDQLQLVISSFLR